MKKNRLLQVVLLMLPLLFFPILGFSQSITISGKVTDEKSEAMIGVAVSVQGTSNGALTDIDGKYEIKADGNATLIFSFMGYETKTEAISGRSVIDVQLAPDNKQIEDVVVIGYGSVKKSDLTGSVAVANLKDFEKVPNTNIVQSLQGTIAGLNIGQVTSAGSTPSIQIRGTNTLAGNTGVLVVIDGIVSGNLSSINPADIESVNILKDASSTAVYGAAASNGVMLITTKKGKSGKPRVNFSSSFSVQSPTKNYKLMNREQYLSFLKNLMWDKAYTKSSGYMEDSSTFKLVNYLPVGAMKDSQGEIVTTNTDWWNLGTQTPFIFENKISISGGNDAISYLISFGKTNQQNLLINDNFKRNNVRVNLDAKIKSWWKVGVQSSASFVNQDGSEPVLWTLYTMNPLVSPYLSTGSLNVFPMENANLNPLTGNNTDDKERHNYFVGNVYSEFNLPIKGLTYRVNFGNNYTLNSHYQANPYGNSQTGECYKELSTIYSYTLDNILNYTKEIGLHSFGATLVYGAAESEYSYTKADATQFSTMTLGYNSLKLGTNQFAFSNANSSSSLYQLARANYKFNDRYLITATIRRDGASSFAANHKIALFPSVALGWVTSQEKFFAPLLPVVNYLKVRTGYGVTGNSLASYKSLAQVSTSAGYVFGDGSSSVIRQELTSMENNDLEWEKTAGTNLGIDFRMFKDRIEGSVDLYKTKTTDLLYAVSIPTITGFSSITSNVGSLENKGIEISLTSHNIVTKDFNWSTTFNFSRNKNKITELTGSGDLVTSGLFIGKSIGAVYGYKIDGIYQVGETVPSGYNVGNYKIHDENGDGKITVDDRTVIGSHDPAYRFSIMNKFTYKDFSLSFFINSVQGGKDGYLGENTYSLIQDNTARGNNHLAEFVKNVWSPSNTSGIYSASTSSGSLTPYRYEDRSFIRLQDITFSYNLPKKLISHLKLENVNIYVSGKNLITLTKWHGWDPEANIGTITPMYNLSASQINKSGDDYEGRPVMKSFTFGIDISF